MAFSGLPESDASSDLTSDVTSSTLTSELTLSTDEEAAPSTRPKDDPAAPLARPKDDPAPSPQVRLRNSPMVVCPMGGRHVVPSWMVEFHFNHCSAGCAHASQRQPRGSSRTEDWEAECGEPSPLALAAAKEPYFQRAPPGLSKRRRKEYYRDLVAQYREALTLQARYDMLNDDQPGPPERFSVEQHGDVESSPKGRKHTLEVGAASPRNAEFQDVASDPTFVAGSDSGDDDNDEAVKVVDEDGTTFYMGRGPGQLTPPAASPRDDGQW